MLKARTWALGVTLTISLTGRAAAQAAAQPAAPSVTVTIPRASSEPQLESFLQVEGHKMPGRVDGFRQREPRDGDPATRGTTAYLSYDQERLYVIFVCQDDPDGVRARLSRREDNSSDDSVSVYLDTFHDKRRAYIFTSNPLGVQAERMKTEGQDDDESFETLWHSEGRLTPFGYVVKFAIPFRSLRFSGETKQTWGVALSRRIQRLNENDYWPLVSRRAQGFVRQFAVAEGLERVSPGSNVQVTPYGVFTDARLGRVGTPFSSAERLGVDTKVGLGSAFVLDAALNPDFSEVESDSPQITVNERFEVFYPERRPFFVENAGYFQTPIPLFFSRRVLDPRGGARVTGKSGRWVTGGLVTPERETSEASAATSIVASVRRDLGRDSHLGALMTMRDRAGASNRSVSVDGRWTIGDRWAAVGQAVRTTTTGEDAAGGTGFLGEIARNSRHFDLLARYTDLSPDFESDLGFIRRVDIRQIDHEVSYRWWPKRGPIVKFGPTLDGFVIWNHARALQDWRLRPRFEMELVGQTSLLIDKAVAFEHYLGQDFDKDRTTIEFETERSRRVSWSTAYEWGTDINRRPVAGQVPLTAERRTLSLSAALRPGRNVRLDQTYLFTALREPGVTGPAGAIFNDHIIRSKLNVYLNKTMSIRTIFDYERLTANATRSTVRQRQPVSVDILGTIQLNPGTALFIGYVDRWTPLNFPATVEWLPQFESVGRQFFVKASWLFRY